MRALKEAGLLEKAEGQMRRGEAEAIKIIDREGKVWLDENGCDTQARGRPEIDR